MATFDQLCQTFPDENCVLSSREILEEVRINQTRNRNVDSSARNTQMLLPKRRVTVMT